MNLRTIWITQLDLERLVDAMRRQRARAGSGQHLAKLQTELDQAQVVESASAYPPTSSPCTQPSSWSTSDG